MKKIFSLFAAILFAGSMMAKDYELMLTLDVASGAPSGTTSTALSNSDLLTYLKEAAPNKSDITAAEKSGDVYKGKGSGGGDIPQACLKIGKASVGASISFTIASTYDNIAKVEITGYGWKTSTAVSVNSSSNWSPTTAQAVYTVPFELSTATKTISINVSTSAFCATEIKLYKEVKPVTAYVDVSSASLDFGTVKQHAAVDTKTFSISGGNLTGGENLTIAAPSGFSVDPTNVPVPANGTLSSTTITVTPITEADGNFDGNITITGAGLASSVNKAVAMTVTATYAITPGEVEGGTFSWEDDENNANPAYASEGTYIQAAAQHTAGYKFVSFDIYKTGESSTKVDHVDGLFEMPAYPVTISGSFEVAPSITVDKTSLEFDPIEQGAAYGALELTITGINLTENVNLVAETSPEGAVFSVYPTSIQLADWNASHQKTVTVYTSTVTAGTFAGTLTISSAKEPKEFADVEVALSVTIQPIYTVTLKDDDTKLPQASYGASIELPSRTGCTDYTFAGWTKSWTDEQTTWTTTAPTIIPAGNYTPTANEDLYPVYTKSEGEPATYSKVTSASEGTYVLVSEKTDGAYRYMPNTTSAGANPNLGSGITLNEAGNALTNDIEDDMLWDFTLKSGSTIYYIRPHGSTSEGLGTTSSTGGNIRISGTYKNTGWTVSPSDDYGWQFKSDASTSMYLAVYNDSNWRNYSNATTNQNGTFYLFKQTGGYTTSYISVPNCSSTDIEEVENGEKKMKAVKFIENGQLFIIKNGHVYNVQGQVVK